MRPPIEPLFSSGFGTELIYSFIIIVCSLMIYFGTKDLYKLSAHKGIKYFRKAFLFFAIAYFFRFFIKSVMIFFNLRGILEFSPRIFGGFTLFIFMYASVMAIFYLLYSVMWKKWNHDSKKIYFFHFLAIAISIISVVSRSIKILLSLHVFLFVLILLIVYIAYKNSKKREHSLYLIYILFFSFWTLNMISTSVPNFLPLFQLIIYLISTGLFLLILYKVLKKTGSG